MSEWLEKSAVEPVWGLLALYRTYNGEYVFFLGNSFENRREDQKSNPKKDSNGKLNKNSNRK